MIPVAIIYDFDGTLARGNLQEKSFIPAIGMKRQEFWDLVKSKTREYDADETLIYMNLMIEKAIERGVSINRADFIEHGRGAEFFDGINDGSWFERINKFSVKNDVNMEHYIISSGIEDMIRGSGIEDRFKTIFSSKFHYENDVARYPIVAINYTTKTQYLFRINKGIPNNWDNKKINSYTPESRRNIPFKNMIFIGDGDTDIPTMKMLTYKGGHSIAVYDPKKDRASLTKIHSLIADDRVNFVAPADYSENSQIEIIVKGIVGRIKHKCEADRYVSAPVGAHE